MRIDAPAEDAKPSEVELNEIVRQRERFSASVELATFDGDIGEQFEAGVSRLTLMTIQSGEPNKPLTIVGTLVGPNGSPRSVSMRQVAEVGAEGEKEAAEAKEGADQESDKEADEDAGEDTDEDTEEDTEEDTDEDAEKVIEKESERIALTHPLGAFGATSPPVAHSTTLFRGGTVWTCGSQGKIENGDVLVRDGRIVEVGTELEPPPGTHIVDAKGKHITPGLIDCHSHAATDGGVNESGQVVTAEVRIGDFIDNTDVSIYRQLAGGVTTANILHGSANPIGGQSQVVKFRWGESMDAMKWSDAPGGIKFALGENVKRTTSRYPNTRMGVEQLLRDQFLAARQYDADWQAWEAGDRSKLPPRRDLQLEALVEIQKGSRWIHCHSYRQDEIVATLDVLEEFNIQIGTLQHILEGYKVADRIASHGAMASSFADWWAYKFEVFDAIPYNGVLMHNAGIVVSFNSDDAELARHLNTEAAKATKYGGVPEQEALKFVTLNPAKQLRIEDRVGSIEVGKDADLVLWSGRPMSTTSRCEQTWIDGKLYFSIATDRELRARDEKTRLALVRLASPPQSKAKKEKTEVANTDESKKPDEPKEPEEEDRWLRFDIFCNAAQSRGDNQ